MHWQRAPEEVIGFETFRFLQQGLPVADNAYLKETTAMPLPPYTPLSSSRRQASLSPLFRSCFCS